MMSSAARPASASVLAARTAHHVDAHRRETWTGSTAFRATADGRSATTETVTTAAAATVFAANAPAAARAAAPSAASALAAAATHSTTPAAAAAALAASHPRVVICHRSRRSGGRVGDGL